MNNLFKGFLIFSMSAFVLNAQAQAEAEVFTLKQSVNYALQNSFDIRKARLDITQADHMMGEVRSQGLPQINGSGTLQNYPNLPTQLLPGEIAGQAPGTTIPVQFGTSYNVSGGFSASQMLYDQSFITGLKAAKSTEELYNLMQLGTEEDVIYAVSNAFYGVLEFQAQHEILENNIEQIIKLEELMKTRFENDLVTKTDLSRLKVNRTNLETSLQSLQTAETKQQNYLKLLMGLPIETMIELQKSDNIAEISLESLSYQKLQPIQVNILDKQIELNELNKKNYAAGYYPTLSAFGEQTWQAQRNEFDFFDGSQPWFQQTVIGVKLQIPIFDGRRKHHQIAQSKIQIQKAEIDRENFLRGNQMEYNNAYEQLMNTMKSVHAQQDNKDLAQEVYDQTQELYDQDVATLTDFLDAESALREAQVNYFRELLKFKRAELDLLKSQGQLIAIAKS